MAPKEIRVLICVPTRRGIQPETMTSILDLVLRLYGIGASALVATSRLAGIAVARNWLAGTFLERSDCTHLLFVDDDVAFRAGDVVRMLERDVPVIGGAYRAKTFHPNEVSFTVGFYPRHAAQTPVDGTIAVDHYGLGLVLIKREALVALDEAHRDLRFRLVGGGPHEVPGIFSDEVRDGLFVGEDVAFCHRWRTLGGTCWLLLDCPTSHIINADGYLMPRAGNFKDFWAIRHGYHQSPEEPPALAVAAQ